MSFLSIITAASTAAESAAESIAETVAETAAEGGAVTSMVPEDFAFDYTMRVPVLSIILMVIALAVMIAVPVYLIIRMKNRFRFVCIDLWSSCLHGWCWYHSYCHRAFSCTDCASQGIFVSKHSCFRHLACHTSDRI